VNVPVRYGEVYGGRHGDSTAYCTVSALLRAGQESPDRRHRV